MPVKETIEEKKPRKPRAPITLLTDPSITPTKVEQIGQEYIMNYCVAQGDEAIDWLAELSDQKIVDKNGKEAYIGHFSMRTAFIDKYFPHLSSKAKEKPLSMREKIKAIQAERKGK